MNKLMNDQKMSERVCWRLQTRNSKRGFVRPSVCPLESVIELKSRETSVLDTFCVCLSVGGGLGSGWGLDAPAHPPTTI